MRSHELYLNHLIDVFGTEPVFYSEGRKSKLLPEITSLVFNNIPEKGFVTGFSYGLSLYENANWKAGRPELTITVQSDDTTWGRVPGIIAREYGNTHSFSYTDVFDTDFVISPHKMSAYVVMAPSIIPKELYLSIDVGASYKVNIAGLYPIYKTEVEVIRRMGLKEFFHNPAYDMYDISRQPLGAGWNN